MVPPSPRWSASLQNGASAGFGANGVTELLASAERVVLAVDGDTAGQVEPEKMAGIYWEFYGIYWEFYGKNGMSMGFTQDFYQVSRDRISMKCRWFFYGISCGCSDQL